MTVEPRVQRIEDGVGELLEEHAGRASHEELSRWEDDPVGWDLEAGRDPVDYQREIMESVAENKRTAWRGCHACGKDYTIGSLAVWGAYARGMLVLVVSATERQVLGQTMREVRKAWRACRRAHGIGGQLFQGSVRIGGEDRIVALTGSANVDALTGWHDAENGVLVLISEGQGERLEEAAYDAAEGNVTTSQGRILAAGNPVRPDGRFYKIHQRPTWNRFRTSAFDTPNVKADEVERPGFPAPGWPEDVAREYGENSAFYKGRVLAEFPDQVESALYRREWIERAFKLHEDGAFEEDRGGELAVAGIDVAREGTDRSCLCVRRGRLVEEFTTWRGAGTQETARRVREILERAHETNPVRRVVVDEVGVGGGVLDRLREDLELTWSEPRHGRFGTGLRERSATLAGFKAGTRARDAERFYNLASQAYWRLRSLLEAGELALPPEEELREELLALRHEVTSDSRVRVDKGRAKARLGRSPDRVDALAFTLEPELEEADSLELIWT